MRAAIKADNIAYDNKVQAITDKKGAADASLLYGDENRATTLMTEAQGILDTLPASGKTRQNKKTELTKTLDESWQKLRKLTVVTPELLTDLAKTNPNAKTNNLIDIDNTLIIFGPDDENFYKLNLTDKAIEAKTHQGVGKLRSAVTPKENDMVVFSVNDREVAVYSKDSSSILNKTINFEKDNARIDLMAIYNRRLYILDIINNAIYKHSPTQSGYDKGVPWLKQDSDLSNSISMAVDGDLFILKTTGEIIKLTGGEKQEFVLSNINPTLDKPSVLRTGSSMNNIYILEPANKRVVVIDKTGKLVAQYTANEWKAPSSIIIDEAGKKVYILDNNKIYKFEL
jgi:DNA-binding beta-propeller fold protein YncE